MDPILESNPALAASRNAIEEQETKFNQSSRLLRETNEALKKRRPPVQPDPNSELAKEQSRIRQLIERNALFIQIVLFLVFLCAIAYLVLPLNIANYTAVAILSIALIYRIFFVE
jgi:Flp pilus assembly protein TadB